MSDPLEPRVAILKALCAREGEWISSASLADALARSRTAISNHVGELKSLGYKISSAPAKGYRLTKIPDTVHAVELRRVLGAHPLAKEIHFFEKTGSTSTQTQRLAEAGAPHGTLVIAEKQTAGRGRLGRKWSSPAGTGLYFSLLLRPPLETHRTPQLTLLAAVALAEAIEEATGLAPAIKWPNDLLWEGKKFCGILTEMAGDADRVRWVILGIGINVGTKKFPKEISPLATSLALALGKAPPRRAQLLAAILRALQEGLAQYEREGFAPFRQRWEKHAAMTGRQVLVSGAAGERRRGIARGLAPDGALLLETPGGVLERVLAGDVTLLKGASADSRS